MFIFSHGITCLKCGGSGLHFLKQREKRCTSGWTIKKICRECFNEDRRAKRKASGELRTDKKREYQRQYRIKNRKKCMEWARQYARRRRMTKKPFQTHVKNDIWDKYGSCTDCKQRTLPHFAKGLCKLCYYRGYQKVFHKRKKLRLLKKALGITGPLPKYLKLGNV